MARHSYVPPPAAEDHAQANLTPTPGLVQVVVVGDGNARLHPQRQEIYPLGLQWGSNHQDHRDASDAR